MKFNKVELTAILSMVHLMVIADGKVKDEEISVISSEAAKFGISPQEFGEIFTKAKDMESAYAVEIISKMTFEQRKYVAAYLGTVMAIDDDIDDTEIALWRLLSQMCGLPSMTVGEAICYISER